MELDDTRLPLQQKYDKTVQCLLALAKEYESLGDPEARSQVEEMVENLRIVFRNNPHFKK